MVSLGICALRASMQPDLRSDVSASDRERPIVAGVNGPLMARAVVGSPGHTSMFASQVTRTHSVDVPVLS